MRSFLVILMMSCWVLLSPQAQSQSLESLCGTSILKDPSVQEEWARLLARNPDLRRLDSKRLASVNLQVGAVDTFWTYNFVSSNFDQTFAELRATGATSYVWVELNELQNAHIDSAVVDVVFRALETKTPPASRDSSKGILQLERQYFGDPPNINSSFLKGQGDGRTHFLVYDIKDGWTGTGGYVAGYFFDVDVDPNRGPGVSNRRDMLYIDSNPGIFNNGQRDTERPLGTLAHEFQHLIHWNYDRDEETFFNEGLSEYASYVCGYGLRRPDGFLNDPGVTFLGWRFGDNTRVLDDYSRAALWTLYLGDRYGSNFIQKLTQNPAIGSSGFNRALDSAGFVSSFTATVRDFHIANYVQSRQVNSAYGYVDTTVVRSKPKTYRNILGSTAQGSRSGLSPLAADYVRFFGPETLMTMFNLSSGTASIKALQLTNTQTSTSDVQPGSLYQAFFQGSERSEVVFVVHNNSEVNSTTGYSYSSTGASKTAAAFELRNDDGSSFSSPNMLLSDFDTVFVLFEGVDGGKIDSVALWFLSNGLARLFVRDANTSYNLVNNPTTGLGGRPRMAAPISFSVTDTGFFKTVVDLRSLNILSSLDFVVELIYGATAPQPLLRRDSDQSIIRSYLSLSVQPTSGVTMYASLGDFYLRVYLSYSPYIAPPPLPATFALFQNYPNPFNPSTTISYDLPRAERVRLEVFDLLGRRVAILVDEFQNAGSPPPVRFDASRLSAGTYFYRLTAGTFVETKKMMVVR